MSQDTGTKAKTRVNKVHLLLSGYLDTKGSRIVNVQNKDIVIEGKHVLSDHRPMTVSIDWPRIQQDMSNTIMESNLYVNVSVPLDPLEPAWGIVQ
jgi:hypothetical protein